MTATAAADRSRLLGERLDALASALREAGVSPETAAGLLEKAASAALEAVALELLLADREAAPQPRPRPAAPVPAREPRPASLAA